MTETEVKLILAPTLDPHHGYINTRFLQGFVPAAPSDLSVLCFGFHLSDGVSRKAPCWEGKRTWHRRGIMRNQHLRFSRLVQYKSGRIQPSVIQDVRAQWTRVICPFSVEDSVLFPKGMTPL